MSGRLIFIYRMFILHVLCRNLASVTSHPAQFMIYVMSIVYRGMSEKVASAVSADFQLRSAVGQMSMRGEPACIVADTASRLEAEFQRARLESEQAIERERAAKTYYRGHAQQGAPYSRYGNRAASSSSSSSSSSGVNQWAPQPSVYPGVFFV